MNSAGGICDTLSGVDVLPRARRVGGHYFGTNFIGQREPCSPLENPLQIVSLRESADPGLGF